MKYKELMEVVDAVQWNKVGDHPKIISYTGTAKSKVCATCGLPMEQHGERPIDVSRSNGCCPGMWVVNHRNGRFEFLTDKEFEERYELIQ